VVPSAAVLPPFVAETAPFVKEVSVVAIEGVNFEGQEICILTCSTKSSASEGVARSAVGTIAHRRTDITICRTAFERLRERSKNEKNYWSIMSLILWFLQGKIDICHCKAHTRRRRRWNRIYNQSNPDHNTESKPDRMYTYKAYNQLRRLLSLYRFRTNLFEINFMREDLRGTFYRKNRDVSQDCKF